MLNTALLSRMSQNITYALWGNNSGSNTLRGSSASCAGLMMTMATTWKLEVVHKEVGGCLTRCARNAASIISQSVRYLCWYRATRAAKKDGEEMKIILVHWQLLQHSDLLIIRIYFNLATFLLRIVSILLLIFTTYSSVKTSWNVFGINLIY